MSKVISILFVIVVVVSSESSSCTTDEDCSLLYNCISSKCHHKPLYPFTLLECFSSVLIFIISSLANSTGIGGGEIMVPLLILLFFFETHSAVPLSLIIMLGGSFIKTVMRMPQRNPEIDRPLICYNTVAYSLCSLLIGSTTGVLINRVIPDWLILMLMTGLLFYTTIHIGMKSHLVYNLMNSKTNSQQNNDFTLTVPDESENLMKIETEPRIFPTNSVAGIAAVYFFVVFFTFIRGDIELESLIGIELCSNQYWAIMFLRFVGLLVGALVSFRIKMQKTQEKIDEDYEFFGEVKWNFHKLIFINAMGVLGGLGVGILGIGGGAIMYPALVYLGLKPGVAKATAGLMILLASSIGSIQYMIAGMITPSYAVWFFFLAIVGASLGSRIVKRIANKAKRIYLPFIALAFVLGITTLLTPTYVITAIVNGMRHRNFQYGFNNFCN